MSAWTNTVWLQKFKYLRNFVVWVCIGQANLCTIAKAGIAIAVSVLECVYVRLFFCRSTPSPQKN